MKHVWITMIMPYVTVYHSSIDFICYDGYFLSLRHCQDVEQVLARVDRATGVAGIVEKKGSCVVINLPLQVLQVHLPTLLWLQ